MSSLYRDLKNHDILQELVVEVSNMRHPPYLIANFAYPIHTYLQKNWKSQQDENKKRYGSVMIIGRIVIENAFWNFEKHVAIF